MQYLRKTKKIFFSTVLIHILIILFLISTVGASSESANGTEGEVSDPYIIYLREKNVVSLQQLADLQGEDYLTRADFTAMLVKAAGLDTVSVAEPSFADVENSHQYYDHIEAAVKAGLVGGYGDGTFKPDAFVTRAEASVLLLRLTAEESPEMMFPETIIDMASDHWAVSYVTVALDAGLVDTASEDCFAPNELITFAEAAKGLAVMLNIAPEYKDVPLIGQLLPLAGVVTVERAGQEPETVESEWFFEEAITVITGQDGMAEITFADGSGVRIMPDTELIIKTMQGEATIFEDGTPSAKIGFLEMELTRGRIFGSLASVTADVEEDKVGVNESSNYNNTDAKMVLASLNYTDFIYAYFGQNSQPEESIPWWKAPFTSKVRVEVDMPWGVAGVRGTMWMNAILEDRQETSVFEGTVEVSAADVTVTVASGQSSSILEPDVPPAEPAEIPEEAQRAFEEVKEWAQERKAAAQEKKPVIRPSVTPPGHGGTPPGLDPDRIPPGQDKDGKEIPDHAGGPPDHAGGPPDHAGGAPDHAGGAK